MPYEYIATISFDVGSLVSAVGDMLKHVNSHASSMGMSEKLVIRSSVDMLITSNQKLNRKEIDEMKSIILQSWNDRVPTWKARVESLRRKPGNVQQLVS